MIFAVFIFDSFAANIDTIYRISIKVSQNKHILLLLADFYPNLSKIIHRCIIDVRIEIGNI